MNAPLPAEIASLLQDEAYAILCRESLVEEMDKIKSAKEKILTTRPPFGMLASSEVRQEFRTSLRAAMDNEAGLQGRLDQISHIDAWLKTAIENALQNYLPQGSQDYHICHEAAQVVGHWEDTIQTLHDLAVALARDAHALNVLVKGGTVSDMKTPLVHQTRARTLANLRDTALGMQAGLSNVLDVQQEFIRLCDAQADGLKLPSAPAFHDAAWVDHVAKLSDSQAGVELGTCETECRTFCATGIIALLREGGEVRESCIDAGRAILAKYWRQLRIHAQEHYVKAREVDEVIAELSKHREAADTKRRQATFENATVAHLR